MVQSTDFIEFIQKTGRKWRCAQCSKLHAPAKFPVNRKITGKMHENCFDLALKPPYLLGKADLNCKFNREFNKQEQGMLT